MIMLTFLTLTHKVYQYTLKTNWPQNKDVLQGILKDKIACQQSLYKKNKKKKFSISYFCPQMKQEKYKIKL